MRAMLVLDLVVLGEERQRQAGDPIRLDPLLVADNLGRLVAASGMTSDYYQADEDWWQ